MTGTFQSPKLAFSIREACSASSLGRTTIYKHIAAGRLKAVRVGGRTVIPAESLHALVGGHRDFASLETPGGV
jgi:excisionase family DNA binding protein